MIIFGGQAPKATSHVFTYDFRLQKWQKLLDMPIKRSRAGCILHDERIYLIGGFNGQSRIRTVDIYDPLTSEWISGVNMNIRRGTLGVCKCNGKIYAVGGYDGVSGLDSAECFNPVTKSWSMICKMSVKRSSLGVVALNSQIFASIYQFSCNTFLFLKKIQNFGSFFKFPFFVPYIFGPFLIYR
jgi:hypothetical protein